MDISYQDSALVSQVPKPWHAAPAHRTISAGCSGLPLRLRHITRALPPTPHAPSQPASPTHIPARTLPLQAPAQLQKIFEANLDLLLSIFNPEGHLDITYLDAQPAAPGAWRVGRDDKGNVFLLQRPAS